VIKSRVAQLQLHINDQNAAPWATSSTKKKAAYIIITSTSATAVSSPPRPDSRASTIYPSRATAATLLQLPYGTRCTLRALALMIGSSGGSKACRGAALEYNNTRIGGIINRASRPLRLALFLSRRRLEMMDGNLRVSKQNDLDHVRILYISWGLIRW